MCSKCFQIVLLSLFKNVFNTSPTCSQILLISKCLVKCFGNILKMFQINLQIVSSNFSKYCQILFLHGSTTPSWNLSDPFQIYFQLLINITDWCGISPTHFQNVLILFPISILNSFQNVLNINRTSVAEVLAKCFQHISNTFSETSNFEVFGEMFLTRFRNVSLNNIETFLGPF